MCTGIVLLGGVVSLLLFLLVSVSVGSQAVAILVDVCVVEPK